MASLSIRQRFAALLTRLAPLLGAAGELVTAQNIYDVSDAKATAVADAIRDAANNSQPAWLLEPDGDYLFKVIIDNRTANERRIITCHQQRNPDTDATEFCWYGVLAQ